MYLWKFQKNLNVPLIASQEVFYLNKEMSEAHDFNMCW